MRSVIAVAALALGLSSFGCQSASTSPTVTRVYQTPDAEQTPWVVRQIVDEQQRRTGAKSSANFVGETVSVTTTQAGQSQIERALNDIRAAQAKTGS